MRIRCDDDAPPKLLNFVRNLRRKCADKSFHATRLKRANLSITFRTRRWESLCFSRRDVLAHVHSTRDLQAPKVSKHLMRAERPKKCTSKTFCSARRITWPIRASIPFTRRRSCITESLFNCLHLHHKYGCSFCIANLCHSRI